MVCTPIWYRLQTSKTPWKSSDQVAVKPKKKNNEKILNIPHNLVPYPFSSSVFGGKKKKDSCEEAIISKPKEPGLIQPTKELKTRSSHSHGPPSRTFEVSN